MSIFHFKKFSVEQEQSAAKITTDATVFASALQLSNVKGKVLEIGTGTGVLALILAQRFSEITIDAIDINAVALEEAKKNFTNSPWKDRLKAILADFSSFRLDKKYDVIFSNPPFFQDNLLSLTNHRKNTAYHTTDLSFKELAAGIDLNLKDTGEAHLMLPVYEMSLLEQEMKTLGLYCKRSIELRHQPASKVIRLFNVFDRKEGGIVSESEKVYVRDENSDFHPSYIKLMKDFLTIF